MSIVRTLLVFALVLSSGITAHAQSIASSLTGSVLDASGSAVSAASVALTDNGTNVVSRTITTDAGVFRISGIRPGSYALEIQKAGFQTYRIRELQFVANGETSHIVRLKVSNVNNEVTVLAEGSLIDTVAANGVRGGTFTSSEANELPLIAGGVGRNFRVLSFQLPGVASQGTAHAPFNVNGTRSNGAMNIMVDGAEFIDINSGRLLAQGLTEQPVSMETVEGVEMQTGNFKAEYGRATGSVTNLITRRGTNALHGSLYSFFQNATLNARNTALTEKPPFSITTPGMTLGGSIRKDKTFFFMGFEITSRDGSSSSVIQTLTDAQRANVVSWLKPIAGLFPVANAGPNLASGSVPSPRTFRQWIGKLDHQLGDKHRIGFKYNYSKQQANNVNMVRALDFNSFNGNQMYVVNSDSQFSPTALNQVKLSYVTYDNQLIPGTPQLGNPAVNGVLGGVTVTGLQNLWSVFRWDRATRTHNYNVSDDFTLSTGPHVIKTGGIYRRMMSNTSNDQNFNGLMIFTSINNFLQGTPVNYQRAFGDSRTDQRGNELGFYVQDDWRLTSNLVLNLGLRYEYYGPFREKFNRIPQLYDADRNNWGPRLGFAYNVGGKSKTVLRGGAGGFYSALFLDIVGQTRFAPPLVSTRTNAFPQGRPNPTIPDFLGTATLSSGITQLHRKLVNPHGWNWNLTVERQVLSPSTVVSVGYVGSKQNLLTRNRRPNGGDNLPQVQRPNTNVGVVSYFDSSANSNYHSVQAMLRSVVKRDLMLRTSYTFGAAIDDVSDATGIYPVDERNLRLDRGRSDYDQPHVLTGSAIYALPFGGKNRLLRGWQTSGTFIYRSALPLNILSNTNNFNGSLINRVNYVPGAILRPGNGSQVFSLAPGITAASLQPAAGLTGTLGRNVFRGNRFRDLSFSVQKSIGLTEGLTMQMRAEAFNILNLANYGAPITNVANVNFGRSLSAQDARQLQFVLKFVF